MAKIYLGGSRHLGNLPIVAQVVGAVARAGHSVHVGCQFGADEKVLLHASVLCPSSLFVFAVAPQTTAPAHVVNAQTLGAVVRYSAGGNSAPMPARFLLRSIAAFQGCESAVFFQPGSGSLAVARECVKSGLPVFAFNPTPAQVPVPPAPIPSCSGHWVPSQFMGFPCWQWLSFSCQLLLF